MNRFFCFAACALGAGWLLAGERPYEMVWAGRTQDDHPALVPFTSVDGWRVETADAEARLERSQDVLLFGDAVAKLTYRATGARPRVTLLPPEPVAVTGAFDAVTCWVYGNTHSYAPDPKTPPVTVALRFADAAGNPFSVQLAQVQFKEWFLCHRRLDAALAARVAQGARLLAVEVTNGRNAEDRTIYLNSLAVFTETFAPLAFAPRRQRGVRVFPDCDPGANTGAEALPFPDSLPTIVPHDSTPSVTRVAKGASGRHYLVRDGEDGRLEVRLPSRLGAWDDLEVRWADRCDWTRVALGGGLYFAPETSAGTVSRASSETVGIDTDGKSVTYSGRLALGGRVANARLHCRLVGKSLVMDVQADGGGIGEVRFGATRGFANPRLVTFPYYTYGDADGLARPAVIVSGTDASPLFYLANIDWTQSNASEPFAENLRFDGSLASNGGTRYHPKTDGRRNPCFERFVLALSPRVEDVLPRVPNPPSPWRRVAGARVWRAHGAGDRGRDAAYWRAVHRWGMTQLVVTDHETGWRDGNESFTFRTAPAPKKGGDEGQFRTARVMQDELGFVYGPYNNYTDFAPVNGFWDIDLVSRARDNQLQRAWERCYAPKPARAVEFCERLAPEIQKKFRFSTAYCDVHTAVTPWSRVDYDARAPGAGTFAAVFYAYGEIMLLQKAAWGGPVYSEGNNHFLYCGLTDGNYAQDQSYRIAENPWLVDFDLRRLHDLCCNFGMGNVEMFYPGGSAPADRDVAADRFLAATVAFGHPGFLMHGRERELRSYYMVQALAARYTQAGAESIRYADAGGALHGTSAALANGAYARSQVVTRYADGTVTAVNGNPDERFVFALPSGDGATDGATNGAANGAMNGATNGATLDLPPNGYWGRSADGAVRVFSGEVGGRRADCSVSPDYTYIDGRGAFARFPEGASAGAAICRAFTNGFSEVILHKTDEAGFPGVFMDAVALDDAGKTMGSAEVRFSRGLSYILPVKGAFSYRVRHLRRAPAAALACRRDIVQPGERVVVRGNAEHAVFIPADATPGERLWVCFENGWIDFTVALPPVARPVPAAKKPSASSALPAWYARGMALRGQPERALDSASGAQLHKGAFACGGVTRQRAFFMHPPYRGGAGYVFARYTLALPQDARMFRCVVGKQDGSDAGDGVLFKVLVEDAAGTRTEIAGRHVAAHAWYALEGSLAPWAGQTVGLLLVTDVGENDDSSGDWGVWAALELVGL